MERRSRDLTLRLFPAYIRRGGGCNSRLLGLIMPGFASLWIVEDT